MVWGEWLLRPTSVEQAEAKKQADKKKKQRRRILQLDSIALKKATPLILDSRDIRSPGVLGLVDSTEEYDYRGVKGNLVYVPEEDLNRHTLVVGTTGTGKTETLLRLALIFRRKGFKVFYISCKADRDTQAKFNAMMLQSGVQPDQLLNFPQEPYDGWRSHPAKLSQRIINMQVWTPASDIYKQRGANILDAIFYSVNPPRGMGELLEMLDVEALKGLNTPRHLKKHMESVKDEDVKSIADRLVNFYTALGSAINGRKSFEDVAAAYFDLDIAGNREYLPQFARYLLNDYRDYVDKNGTRKPQHLGAALIFDEVSEVPGVGINDLLTQVRGSNGYVVLSTLSLGRMDADKAVINSILDNTAVKIVHGIALTDDLSNLAGTKQAPEATFYQVEGEMLDKLSYKMQHQKKINDNVLGALTDPMRRGYAYVIAHRTAALTKIVRLTLPEVELARGYALLDETEAKTRSERRKAAPAPEPLPPMAQPVTPVYAPQDLRNINAEQTTPANFDAFIDNLSEADFEKVLKLARRRKKAESEEKRVNMAPQPTSSRDNSPPLQTDVQHPDNLLNI